MSANVHRRHLTKGQQAMATALAYPDKEKGGRGKKALSNNEFSGASSGYIRQARFVLSNCRDKALEVLRNAPKTAYNAILAGLSPTLAFPFPTVERGLTRRSGRRFGKRLSASLLCA